MIFNKLVRDRIPELIMAQGEKPNIRILDKDEYIHHLEAKLDEEVSEYHRDQTVEELADILEVVFALADTKGIDTEELLRITGRKQKERGGFRQRIFLISKE